MYLLITWVSQWSFALSVPGRAIIIPRRISSRFIPLTSAPNWSPAWASSRIWWNISIPVTHIINCIRNKNCITNWITLFQESNWKNKFLLSLRCQWTQIDEVGEGNQKGVSNSNSSFLILNLKFWILEQSWVCWGFWCLHTK